MRLPNIAFYAFRQENRGVLRINCIQSCTSKKFDVLRLKVYRERGFKGCGRENNKEIKAATDAFNRRLQTLQKKK